MKIKTVRPFGIALVAAGIFAATALGPIAAFADDGGIVYSDDINPNPMSQFSAGQVDLQNIQAPLQSLVSSSAPGSTAVVQLVPERRPTYIMLNIIDADGNQATSEKLDSSAISFLESSAATRGDSNAASQAAAVSQDSAAILQAYQ